MAGIGFELRKYLNDDSFSGTLKAYGFAGLISAGPWVLSILGVMLIGIVALSQKVGGREVEQFTTSVTWIMGSSLVRWFSDPFTLALASLLSAQPRMTA